MRAKTTLMNEAVLDASVAAAARGEGADLVLCVRGHGRSSKRAVDSGDHRVRQKAFRAAQESLTSRNRTSAHPQADRLASVGALMGTDGHPDVGHPATQGSTDTMSGSRDFDTAVDGQGLTAPNVTDASR